MRSIFRLLLLAAGIATGATPPDGAGAPAAAPTAVEVRIKTMLTARLPEANIEAVHRSNIAGLFEVILPTEIAYTNEQAEVLLLGHMIDTRTRMDLGTARWNELHAVPFASLPLELAIKSVRGDGHRRVAIFADPECPYCRQMEQTLRDVDNLTIYTFLFPLEDVHPGATRRSHLIWCANDRAGAWAKWLLERAATTAAECGADPIERLQALARAMDVSATPTLMFADGRRISGVLSRANLEHALNGEPLTYKP